VRRCTRSAFEVPPNVVNVTRRTPHAICVVHTALFPTSAAHVRVAFFPAIATSDVMAKGVSSSRNTEAIAFWASAISSSPYRSPGSHRTSTDGVREAMLLTVRRPFR